MQQIDNVNHAKERVFNPHSLRRGAPLGPDCKIGRASSAERFLIFPTILTSCTLARYTTSPNNAQTAKDADMVGENIVMTALG